MQHSATLSSIGSIGNVGQIHIMYQITAASSASSALWIVAWSMVYCKYISCCEGRAISQTRWHIGYDWLVAAAVLTVDIFVEMLMLQEESSANFLITF